MKKGMFTIYGILIGIALMGQTPVTPSGDGTVGDPWQIATLSNLFWLSQNSAQWVAGKYFIQTADIDASESSGWYSDGSSGYYGFPPIGGSFTGSGQISGAFQGNYDGNNMKIINLYIKNRSTTYGQVGLFGKVTNATIENLILQNMTMNATNLGSYSYSGAGMLVGYGSATLNYITIDGGSISASGSYGDLGPLIGYGTTLVDISYCSSSATVVHTGNNNDGVGGLIGYIANSFVVTYSSATGSVTADGNNKGGFVGDAYKGPGDSRGYFTYCFATGDINKTSVLNTVGGFVGLTERITYTNCYAKGRVYATGNSSGGFFGYATTVPTSFTNCYATGRVDFSSGGGFGGGAASVTFSSCYWDQTTSTHTYGLRNSASATGLTGEVTANMMLPSTYSGWDFTDVWSIVSGINGGYPFLRNNAPPIPTITWDGSESTDWNVAANWDVNAVPSPGDHVVIADQVNDPYIGYNAIASCNNLTVNEGATLYIVSTAEGSGSLITNGTITNNGAINVQRYIVGHGGIGSAGWHLISSPVASFTINGNVSIDPGTNDDLYAWDETTNTWLNHKAGVPSTMAPGTGYLVSYENTATHTFTGTLNNAAIPLSNLSFTPASYYKGYHLLGNPFPCALQWNPTEDNYWALSNVGGTAKVWNGSGASYGDIVANGYIPSMQGFMVYVDQGTNSITIPTANRVHNSTPWHKETEMNVIGLTAHDTEGGTWQETVIRFIPDATEGFDMAYDSKFMGGYAPYLYSATAEGNLSTNVLPQLDESLVIPLTFIKNTSDHFYLEAVGLDNLEPQVTVYLHDQVLANSWNLSKNPVYAFTASDADPYDRFELRFGPVGVDEAKEFPAPLQAWYNKGLLHFSGLEGPARVSVYSLSGQCLETGNVSLTTDYHMELSLPSGLYVVRVVQGDGVKTAKVLAR